jgi:hypothetical protein
VGQCKGICVLVAKIPVCEEEEEEGRRSKKSKHGCMSSG